MLLALTVISLAVRVPELVPFVAPSCQLLLGGKTVVPARTVCEKKRSVSNHTSFLDIIYTTSFTNAFTRQ